MNDTIFIFGVIPLTIGFIGFVYSLVFGPGILRWYMSELAAQQAHAPRLDPEEVADGRHEFERSTPTARKNEQVLAVR